MPPLPLPLPPPPATAGAPLLTNAVESVATVAAERARRSLRVFVQEAWAVVEPSTPYLHNWHIDAICDHLEAVTRGDIRNLLINIPPRSMKCAAAGSMVWMADGTRKPIEQVQVGDEVLSSDGVSITSDRVTRAWRSGVKRVLSVRLNDGRMVHVTPEHRLFGWDSWALAGELRTGDALCVAEQTPDQRGGLSHDDAFLLALWLAEGDKSLQSDGYAITNGAPEIVGRLRTIAEARGWCVKQVQGAALRYYVSCGGKQKGDTPLNLLRQHNLYHQCGTATIGVPDAVCAASSEVVATFLGTYIACDGCIAMNGYALVVESSSERMVRDLQLLVTRFHVRSTVTVKHFLQDGKERVAWIWRVSGAENLRRLSVVLHIPGKQTRFMHAVDGGAERTAERTVPPEWRQSLRWSTGWHRLRGLRIDKPGWTDRRKAQAAADAEGNAALQQKLSGGLGWRSVVDVREAGEVATYDLETAQHHAFFLDGILSHNSTCVSVMWPMWVWLHRPGFQWLFASYALSLALRDSLKCRRLVESAWYQRHYGDLFHLADDQQAKGRFENDARGYRLATSVDSAVTGEGGNAVVADDPHNVREAESQAERETVLEWWDNAMSSRLNDPRHDSKVIVMQRVHERDLSGHVLEQGGYVHLCLPMEYERDRRCVTVLGSPDPREQDGTLLWPDRIGPVEVADLKERRMAPHAYAGQYQQRPAPREGAMFKAEWFAQRYRSLDALPRLTRIEQAIDSAFKTGVASDYSVIATWGTNGVDYFVLDVWRARVDFPTLVRAIVDQYWRWQRFQQTPQQPGPGVAAVLIEDAASGQSAYQQLRKDTNLPVLAVRPEGSKESRADGVTPVCQALKVWLPASAEWVAAWLAEHTQFPRAAHDDQVDTTSMVLAHLQRGIHRDSLPYASASLSDAPLGMHQLWQQVTAAQRDVAHLPAPDATEDADGGAVDALDVEPEEQRAARLTAENETRRRERVARILTQLADLGLPIPGQE